MDFLLPRPRHSPIVSLPMIDLLKKSLKDPLAGTVCTVGAKLSELAIRQGNLSIIDGYCQQVAKISPNGELLTQLQWLTAKNIVEQAYLRSTPVLASTIAASTHCALGVFKDFVLADTYFKERQFDKSAPLYYKHFEKVAGDSDYFERIKKIKITSNSKSSPWPPSSSATANLVSPQKTVIYTVISGAYDTLHEPKKPGPYDYLCFTDQNLSSETWKIQKISKSPTPVLQSREFKMRPHVHLGNYEASLYVDGNVNLVGDMEELIENNLKTSVFSMFHHENRNGFYKEARAILQRAKARPEGILNQCKNYFAQGLPAEQGLFEGGLIWRHHRHPKVAPLMEAWWSEFSKYPFRDQLSLAYLLWKHQVGPTPIPTHFGNAHQSSFHKRERHERTY